jgi:hypothetical protein
MSRSDEDVGRVLRDARPQRDPAPARERGLAKVLSGLTGQGAMPKKVGRFVVEQRVGDDKTNALFRAYDPELQRTILLQLLGADEEHREAFLEHAQRLAAIEHPGLLKVFDVGQAGETLYVAMEFVAGITLETWLRARPDASWRQVVELFAQAGRGLAALVDAGFSYPRFDPADVIVGDDGRVRLRGLLRREDLLEASDVDPSASFLFAIDDVLRRLETASAMRGPRALRQLIRPGVREGQTRVDLKALTEALEHLLDPAGEDRDRALLLNRVQRFWVDGVLTETLGAMEPVPLWIRLRPETLPKERADAEVELPDHASTEDLREILDETADRILLLGAAGSGKTTALLRLAYLLIDAARADPTQPAPLVLNLASWSSNGGSIAQWVEEEVLTKYALPKRSTRRWIDRGELVLLLDGLDEVLPALRKECIERINEFCRSSTAQTVVCSREDEYLAVQARLDLDLAVSLDPLDDIAVEGMVEELGERAEGLREAMQRHPELLEHARSPLVLGMLAVVGGDVGDDPERFRRALYDRYVDSVFRRRASKGPYSREEVVDGLRWLAAAMTRTGQAELWLERLQRDLFPTTAQRWGAHAIGVFLIFLVTAVINTLVALPGFPIGYSIWSGIAVAMVAIPLSFAFIRSTRVVPVTALTWSWQEARRRAPATFVFGLLASAGYGIAFMNSLAVVMSIPVLFILAGMRGLRPRDEASGVSPNQGIHQSATNAVWLGLAIGLASGFVFDFVVMPGLLTIYSAEQLHAANIGQGVVLFLGAAAAFGGVAALTYGGIAVGLHAGVRLMLALATPLPLKLQPFLDYAVQRALLRRVGGGWVFVHRALQEHFAEEA